MYGIPGLKYIVFCDRDVYCAVNVNKGVELYREGKAAENWCFIATLGEDKVTEDNIIEWLDENT